MSKEQEHIDKLIKAKLADRNFGAPPKTFINDINLRLDLVPKKPFSFYFFTLLTSLLFGVFLILLLFPTEFKFPVQIERVLVGEAENKNEFALESIKSGGSEELAIKAKKDSHNNNNNNNNNNNIDAQNQNLTNKKVKNGLIAPVREIQKTERKKKFKEFMQTKSQNELKANTNAPASTEDNSALKSNQSTNSLAAINSERNAKNTDLSKIIKYDSKNSYQIISAYELPLIREKIVNWDFFNTKNVDPISEVYSKPILAIENEIKKKKFTYELQLFGGIGFDKARINNTISDDYATQLNSQSENEMSPHMGLNVNIIYKNLIFGSGFTFTQQREDNDFMLKTTSLIDSFFIAYYHEDIIFDSVNLTVDTIYTPVYDSTQITTEQWNKFEIEQNYSWIQIPIHFGYRFQFNKWAITPSVGVNFAIGLKNKSMRYPDQNFEQFEEYSAVKWNMNLQGNLEIRRQINQWHVFVNVGYHYGINPVLKSSLFHRKYNSLNAVFGIGYTF